MTAPTPSVIWVVGDGEGDVLHSTTDKDVADEHFQMCVDEPNDFRSGPYTLTEYVPKRDLAAREAELAEWKRKAEEAERYKAAAMFAGKVIAEIRDSLADLDGGWLQNTMTECGMLECVTLQGSCGDECRCDEWNRSDEERECYRLTDAARTAIAAKETK